MTKETIKLTEDNYGYWYESEYDKIGNQIYFEDSGGWSLGGKRI